MKNDLIFFPSVAFIKCQDNLGENAPNEVLSDKCLRGSGLPALLNEFLEIASLADLHDQINRGVLLVDEFVIAPHNVLMLQFSQYVHLVDQLLLLFVVHAAVISLLPYHLCVRGLVQHQRHLAVAALTKVLVQNRVILHLH